MKRWKKYAAGLLLTAGLSPQVHAQLGAVPAAPAAVPVAAVPVAPAAAPPANLWTFLCLSPEQKAACKEKLCNSALGQMLNNGLKPASTFSGGLIPSFCPDLKAADLMKPADSAEGAAARAKADEADAKARREAVRFLGTVDCHYWPEAQEALVNALRGDRNECVRLEAAFALNRGCCCSKMIIKALVICVSGDDVDGFPSERSERVRGVAQAALVHCLACYTEVVPVPPEVKKDTDKEPVPPPREGPVPRGEAKPAGTPDKLPAAVNQPLTPAEYYKRIQLEPRQQLIAESQHILAHLKPVAAQAAPEGSPSSVLDIFQHAFGGSSTTVTTTIVRESVPPPSVVTKPVPMKVADVTPPAPPRTTLTEKSMSFPPVVPTPSTAVPARALASAPTIPPLPPVQTMTPKPSVPATVSSLPPAIAAQALTTVPSASPSVWTAAPKAAVQPIVPSPATAPASVPTVPTVKATDKVTPVRPATTTTATANNGMNMTLSQVVAMLRESPHPEYRDWAAENLATVDGWTNPDVVAALAKAARTDHVPNVRATCVRSLGRMRCGTLTAMSAVQSAKSDPDLRVRREAELALQLVGGVQGVSLTVPSGR